MKVTVCIGSSCHLKGSRKIVEVLQDLIRENDLDDKVELGGTFCIGQCQKGVCVTINEEVFSVSPENVRDFFEENIAKKGGNEYNRSMDSWKYGCRTLPMRN